MPYPICIQKYYSPEIDKPNARLDFLSICLKWETENNVKTKKTSPIKFLSSEVEKLESWGNQHYIDLQRRKPHLKEFASSCGFSLAKSDDVLIEIVLTDGLFYLSISYCMCHWVFISGVPNIYSWLNTYKWCICWGLSWLYAANIACHLTSDHGL